MKPIGFSAHALQQMQDRGASRAEVIETIRRGRREAARRGHDGYRLSFAYNAIWNGRRYNTKQVLVIAAEQPDRLVVVTVYTFYF